MELDSQNRVHLAHELHPDINGAFRHAAAELNFTVSIFYLLPKYA